MNTHLPHRFYNASVLKYFHCSRYVGCLDENLAHIAVGKVGDAALGDVLYIWLQGNENGEIVHACFKAYGSVATIACGARFCAWAIGLSINKVSQVAQFDIAKDFALPATKRYAITMAEQALMRAAKQLLRKYKNRENLAN